MGINLELINNELERSGKALDAAKKLLEEDLLEDCLSRAYYSVLHAAKAGLLKVEIETNSHKGARSMFGLHLVKPGLIEKEYATILVAVQEDRELGDYAIGILIERERAVERVEQAGRFLERIKLFVGEMS